MTIIEFIRHFPNEESCEALLKEYLKKTGVYCKTCKGFAKQYWFPAGSSLNAAFVGGGHP